MVHRRGQEFFGKKSTFAAAIHSIFQPPADPGQHVLQRLDLPLTETAAGVELFTHRLHLVADAGVEIVGKSIVADASPGIVVEPDETAAP